MAGGIDEAIAGMLKENIGVTVEIQNLDYGIYTEKLRAERYNLNEALLKPYFELDSVLDEVLGDAVQYLIPNIRLKVEMFEGRPVGIELPQTVDLKVVETVPAIKGATATNQLKPATVETGIVIIFWSDAR